MFFIFNFNNISIIKNWKIKVSKTGHIKTVTKKIYNNEKLAVLSSVSINELSKKLTTKEPINVKKTSIKNRTRKRATCLLLLIFE